MDILNIIDEFIINSLDMSFDQVYLFTNENINGYKSYFNLKDKNLLTVGSSLDQAINASLDGCKDITVCDICTLTKYYYYLKLASLIKLKKEEFINFLCLHNYDNKYNHKFLTKKTFNIIKDTLKVLDYDSYYVWNTLINKYNNLSIRNLFRNDISSIDSIINCNTYLNDEYYNKIGNILQNININFVIDDITTYTDNKKYDNIWLSNVAQYLNSDNQITMLNNCYDNLDNNGMALLCYFWNTSMTVKGFPVFDIEDMDALKIVIPGINENEDEDSVLVYKMK